MIELEGINKKSAELIALPRLQYHTGDNAGFIQVSMALMISCRGTKHEIEALTVIEEALGCLGGQQPNAKALLDIVIARAASLKERYEDS